jgi:hypothetical protein
MKDFIDACPNRPLFVYNVVDHAVPMGQIKDAMDRFSPDEVEAVHLDELLLLADKAYKEGKITSELYPEKDGLKDIIAKEAVQKWPSLLKEMEKMAEISSNGEEEYIEKVKNTAIGIERIVPADFLAFASIWNSMSMIKLALESKGIYVNNKPVAVERFLEEYKDIEDAKVVFDLQEVWVSWHHLNPDYNEALDLTKRLLRVARQIDKKM